MNFASSKDNPIVQYYIVNHDLGMSAGKIAAQTAHAATTLTLHTLLNDKGSSQELFRAWLESGQRKIVLKARTDELTELANNGYLAIRDAGHTEVPSGSLTVVVLPPMLKSEAQKLTGRFSLL
ncbi:aminoacyl-tRNA hydrolase [Paenibacillus tarimensis]|uniref:aminoacyl-tRNA hydrolase n=1 Tax=Paenibacillus tarimensis TaxID=416012 RepID=UPI001F479421|nr:aminoacyl-tRNA hydrolase [Paenibacillus tarimensis]MCF2945713.1 peptidyl-tRNA hydrolase [Paenibacillus tarimensis]